MPSDDRRPTSRSTPSRAQLTAYRRRRHAAAEQARAVLAAGGGTERARLELGALGAARIDAARFAGAARTVSALDRVERELLVAGGGRPAARSRCVAGVRRSSCRRAGGWPPRSRGSLARSHILAARSVRATRRSTSRVRGAVRCRRSRRACSRRMASNGGASAERMAAPPLVVARERRRPARRRAHRAPRRQRSTSCLSSTGSCPPARARPSDHAGHVRVADDRRPRARPLFVDYRGPAIAALVDDRGRVLRARSRRAAMPRGSV